MNNKKELKKNLENFIEMFGLEQKKQGDIVARNQEIYYHYLGAEYEEDKQSEHDYGLTKDISYLSSHDIHNSEDEESPPMKYKEYLFGIEVSIYENS